MNTPFKTLPVALAVSLTCLGSSAALADKNHDEHGKHDFGAQVEYLMKAQSERLFGINKTLGDSAPETTAPTRIEGQRASDHILLASGLKAEFVTREAANNTDMMVFWPNDEHPTHIFTAVEVFAPATTTDGKPQPFVQRVDLATGKVDVVLRGGLGGDPIRRTAWGTLVVGEETATGAVYEILDPLNVTEAVITDRASGANTHPDKVAKRPALGIKSWEGIGLLDTGVMYSGDELRPGDTGPDRDGGTIYKFVPATPHMGGMITALYQSPLAAGSLYAMQVSSREIASSAFPRYGQGSETGVGAWVVVDAENARADAADKGATGYYRPEDLELDPYFAGEGVRFCWANTQRENAESYGEVMCAVDHQPEADTEREKNGLYYLADASGAFSTFSVNRFIEGSKDFNSFDNLAFQPGTGNLFVVEDHPNGDVWSCLPDGADEDLKSDGCVKVASVVDSDAEPSGLFFSKNGETAYLSIMHSNDANMPLVKGWPTDDIVKITGFKVKKHD
jgi:hypothetical protein